MFNSYSSDYANQVHQLSISVSKHYWVTKDEIVKYQKKPFEERLVTLGTSPKAHLVLYVVRDHFSGLFYSKAAASSSLISPLDFLLDAWADKSDFVFCGLPAYVSIPDTIEAAFPGTRQAVSALGVDTPKVTSGFHGGIRDIRTIEDRLGSSHNQPLEAAKRNCLHIGKHSEREICRDSHRTKAEVWATHRHHHRSHGQQPSNSID
ncbi:hypothetical protein JN531_005080 [Flagellatimonas centrodinii]|uniref:hypothetical protein n=1 Tax=Flagellatimonas centrodinii TaxID=2806210 RepID=UPI001FEE93AA|nr:hypothetical protein [Flagellatimonas centrodinii]ULQ47662.1 hypothetical protein JN531_005080 [Flagellatimonas centrodinii]